MVSLSLVIKPQIFNWSIFLCMICLFSFFQNSYLITLLPLYLHPTYYTPETLDVT